VTTTYTLDLAAGLTQVLSDENNTYQYGVGRIAQADQVGKEYFLGDALGSVRQLTDASGVVSLAKSYKPYGDELSSAGEADTTYGFVGEWTDNTGLIYLRARYLDPGAGRFISRDSWGGVPDKPPSQHKWLYGYSNPVIFVDRSGFSATVDCEKIWLIDMRSLCHKANGDDNDPNVLDARYQFFWKISEYSKLLTIANNGFWWAGDMLQSFLLKSGYKNITLPYRTSLARDQGIFRAIKEKLPLKYNDEPKEITPLLYKFLKDLKPQIGCDNYQIISKINIDGRDTYIGVNDPRPHGLGWWGAFGHIEIDAEYQNIVVVPIYTNNGYIVKTQVRYIVDDRYEWFGDLKKETPLPLGSPNLDADYFPPVDLVKIPHEWEESLVNNGLASEYDYNITWTEYMQIVVSEDFNNFLIVGESNWLPLK
jgi:RHS repeat-associated protein